MILLSIDSGLEKTGLALFNFNEQRRREFHYLHSDLIRTKKTQAMEKRLQLIYEELKKIILKYKPNLIIVERLFFFKNLKTAIAVAQSQGVVLLLASQKNIPIKFMTPLEVKQIITGYGRADKKSVQKMLRLTLHLDGELKNDDVADAIACGAAYCYIHQKSI